MPNRSRSANPWLATRTRTGQEYDAPYEARAAAGIDVHGEAICIERLVQAYATPPYYVLDGGCGTGRVAIELAHRGMVVVGVDLDAVMLTQARSKAPQLDWRIDDLSTMHIEQAVDCVICNPPDTAQFVCVPPPISHPPLFRSCDFSPQVPVFRDDARRLLAHPWHTSIITAAAVNAGTVRRNQPHRSTQIRPTLERRARMLLAIAAQQQCAALLLGAWGCGVVQNDPVKVAQIFKSILAEPAFERRFQLISFAVYDSSVNQAVLRAFQRTFPA